MESRPYQLNAVNAIWQYFASGNTGNPVVAMPTGTGKSVVIGKFVKSVFEQYPGQRILMLTHVKELISQNFDKLLKMWPTAPAAIYSAGLKKRNIAPITYAGIGSIVRNTQLLGHVDLILVDECHLVSDSEATMYQKVITALRGINPHLKVIGFSATPWRVGVGHITAGELFTDVCFDLTTRNEFLKLIDDGYLAPLVPKRTKTQLDITGVHMQGGDFKEKELQAAVDKETVSYYALQELCELAAMDDRRHWLIFTTGIEHTEHVTEMLVKQFGVKARAVHSKMDEAVRDANIAEFKAGKFVCLVNNNMLTTGHDFPEVDLIGVLRPTASSILWVQMLGRGTRPFPGKYNCLVADFAGNTERLGPINDPVLPRKRGTGGGEAPVRCCEVCETYSHASAKVCECCGTVFPVKIKFGIVASEKELVTGTLPIVDTFKVTRVVYGIHSKEGRPDTLKVSYYCGMRLFQEWVCFEHTGFALHKAHDWWRARSPESPPVTVEKARDLVENLKTPTAIKVWHNKKYPEVMGYEFEQ